MLTREIDLDVEAALVAARGGEGGVAADEPRRRAHPQQGGELTRGGIVALDHRARELDLAHELLDVHPTRHRGTHRHRLEPEPTGLGVGFRHITVHDDRFRYIATRRLTELEPDSLRRLARGVSPPAGERG